MASKRVLYFTAAAAPTVAEQAAIDRLNALAVPAYDVQIRNGAADLDFLETADYAAGTVPTAYNAVPLIGGDGKIDALRPLAFKVVPPTYALSSGTFQLRAVAATGSSLDAITMTDVTASTDNTTYASSATSKATVSAEGVVTKVAAGETTITATHTYASGKTVTSTCVVTVS